MITGKQLSLVEYEKGVGRISRVEGRKNQEILGLRKFWEGPTHCERRGEKKVEVRIRFQIQSLWFVRLELLTPANIGGGYKVHICV